MRDCVKRLFTENVLQRKVEYSDQTTEHVLMLLIYQHVDVRDPFLGNPWHVIIQPFLFLYSYLLNTVRISICNIEAILNRRVTDLVNLAESRIPIPIPIPMTVRVVVKHIHTTFVSTRAVGIRAGARPLLYPELPVSCYFVTPFHVPCVRPLVWRRCAPAASPIHTRLHRVTSGYKPRIFHLHYSLAYIASGINTSQFQFMPPFSIPHA